MLESGDRRMILKQEALMGNLKANRMHFKASHTSF